MRWLRCVATCSGMLMLACTGPTRSPRVDEPQPVSADEAGTTARGQAIPAEDQDQGENDASAEPSEAPPPAPTIEALSGVVRELKRDAEGVCMATIVHLEDPDRAPTLGQVRDRFCDDRGESIFVGQRVTPTLVPCGDEPHCGSPDAIVVGDFHIRGMLAAFDVDAAAVCFVVLSTSVGMVYFPADDELCWGDGDFTIGAIYETTSTPCGQNMGCRYVATDTIVGGLRSTAQP